MICNEKISIIIPAYNIEKYIKTAVYSVLNQTYSNLEVIVVNDGSSDGTKDILSALVLEDERIKVINKSNEGVTSARLAGVAVATGEWIGFVDGDDRIDANMYEKLLENAHEYHAQISHCGYQMVFPNHVDYYYDTRNVVIQDNETGLKDLLEGDFIEPGLCNKLYYKDLFHGLLHDKLMDVSIRNNEDLLMNYYLFKQSKCSIYEDWCPYYYILRMGSASTAKLNKHQLEDPLKVLKMIRSDLSKNELVSIVDARILARLINATTMSSKGHENFVRDYKVWAKKELKVFWDKVDKTLISKRMILMTRVALWCPKFYAIVHKVYAVLKGTDKKYKIE